MLTSICSPKCETIVIQPLSGVVPPCAECGGTGGVGTSGGIEEAPMDGESYVRRNGTWVVMPASGGTPTQGPIPTVVVDGGTF